MPEEAALAYDGDASEDSSAEAAVLTRHESRLLALPGVEGVGIGADAIGRPAIVLYVSNAGVQVPRDVEGIAVETVVVGQIDALSPPGH